MNRIIIILLILISYYPTFGQSAFLDKNADDFSQLERFEILRGKLSDYMHIESGAVSRKDAVKFLEEYLDFLKEEELEESNSKDIEQIKAILAKNSNWANNEDEGDSDYNLFDVFYKKRAELFSVDHPDFFIAANPIFNYQQMVEIGNEKQNLFQNRKGVEIRATIKDRIGIYSAFTDNQERGPLYHQRLVANNEAIPGGVTYYKDFKPTKAGNANDYILASGYVDAEVVPNTLNVSFGHSRFKLGDGYRSLMLSDFGSNYLFLRFNTRFWKINFQNLFMELTPQYNRGADQLLPKKYAAMHHLSLNVNSWLNIGLYESIIFSRENHFEFQYLNPVILYRAVEQGLGSPDNALLGLNFKANPNVGALFYGQFVLDEFKFSELIAGDGWWANKYAIQGGIKFADPFGVNNLLVQTELNIVRPFMYSYNNGISEYSHYNQPLAHPFGSNFTELLLNVNYKPHKKVLLNLTSFYIRQGRDSSATTSYGGDIFKPSNRRFSTYGNKMFNGFVSNVFYTNLNLSYEVRPNIYLDFGGGLRTEDAENSYNPTDNSAFAYGGLRWNAARRNYNY